MMSSKLLEQYIDPLLTYQTEHLQTIRIGTKALSHWPYRFLAIMTLTIYSGFLIKSTKQENK